MSLLVSLYVAILFFVLTPGILLSLPKGGSKFKVAGVHALVFAVVFYFTHKLVWRFGVTLEGADNMGGPTKTKTPTPDTNIITPDTPTPPITTTPFTTPEPYLPA
jgi:hypothetical protein